MKKKLATTLSVVLILGLAVLGILAYLTDTDSDVNVMTLGNVQIEQNEQQRVEDDGEFTSALEGFDDDKILMPVTYPGNRTADTVKIGDYTIELSDDEANYVDKIISVTNTGKSDAYVRTLVAVPTGGADWEPAPVSANECWLHWNIPTDYAKYWTLSSSNVPMIEIDGENYYVWEFVHKEAVVSGETTYPMVRGFYMDQRVDNDDEGFYLTYADGTTKRIEDIAYDDKVQVIALTQAVQTEGFADAQTALDTAFGKLDAATAADWFSKVPFPVVLDDAAAIAGTMKTLPDGTDITKSVVSITYGKKADYPEIVNGGYATTVVDGVSAYYVPNGSNYDVYMLAEGTIYAPTNAKGMFQDLTNVKTIDTSNLDFSTVENALAMFANCSNLESLDTANWDVSNITNMQSIFYGCNNLKDIDVSNWDTSNVTNMRMVFFRCYDLPDEVLKGVENWDVSNVTNFHSMFKHAYGIKSLDLSKWDTSNATNMTHMFANIGANLTTLDLSGFDTSKVTDMSWMFYGADHLTTIYVGDKWTTAALDPANPTCFYNNQALVGGEGTTWLDVCDMANQNRPWESSAKLDYAIVDGGTSNPGLFTHK